MKKYRAIEGGRLDKLLKHKTALGLLAASTAILIGMSAATLAFAEPVVTPPAEPESAIVEVVEQPAVLCEEPNKEPEEPELVSLGEFTISHYCREPYHHICNNGDFSSTATGTMPTVGRTIAVDPDVIPYGSEVMIDGHVYVAEDCGGLINDKDIDILVETHDEADQLGMFTTEVFLVKEGAA